MSFLEHSASKIDLLIDCTLFQSFTDAKCSSSGWGFVKNYSCSRDRHCKYFSNIFTAYNFDEKKHNLVNECVKLLE